MSVPCLTMSCQTHIANRFGIGDVQQVQNMTAGTQAVNVVITTQLTRGQDGPDGALRPSDLSCVSQQTQSSSIDEKRLSCLFRLRRDSEIPQ